MKRKRWPDCNAPKVVERRNNIPMTLTCTKPAMHLGKHHDYYAQFTWRRESMWEALA
jgi:hypothetical protein